MELQGLKGIDQTYIRMPETYMDKLQGFKSKIFKDSVMEPGFIESLTAPEGSPINYDNISSMAGSRLRKAKEGLIDPVIDSVKNYAEVMNRGLHGEINRKNLSIKDQLSIITGMVDTAVGGMFSAPKKALGFDPNTLNMFVGPSAKDIVKAEGMAMRGASKKEIQDTLLMHKKPDGFWRKEISDSGLGQRLHGPANGIEEYTPMGSTYPHPELYDQYPNMKNINTTWNNQDSGGSYTKNGPMEYVNLPQNADWETQGKTTIHELQHAIQEKEGWARGGSPEEFTTKINKKINAKAELMEFQDELIKKHGAENVPELVADNIKLDKEIDDLLNSLGKDEPYKAYQNLLGEREARDTASRLGLSLEERRGALPDLGEGATVKMGGLRGLSASVTGKDTVTHTSPVTISKIHNDGKFGDTLFFSDDEYIMTGSKDYHTYELDIDKDNLLDVERLFYDYDPSDVKIKDDIDHVMSTLSVDRGTAEGLLDGSINEFDIEMDFDQSDAGWFIQKKQAEIAKKLGYEGAEMADEQGVVYAIPMMGREKELRLKK